MVPWSKMELIMSNLSVPPRARTKNVKGVVVSKSITDIKILRAG